MNKRLRNTLLIVLVLSWRTVSGQGIELSTVDYAHSLDGTALFEHFEDLVDSADFYNRSENIEQALYFCAQAQGLENRIPETNGPRVRLHTHLAIILSKLEAYNESIEHLHLALRLHKQMPEYDSLLYYMNHGMLGTFYMRIGKNKEAAEIFGRTVKLAEKMGIPCYKASAHNNLGIALLELNKLDAAGDQFEKALSINNTDVDSILMVSATDNLAQYHSKKGHFEKALDLYQQNFVFLTKGSKVPGTIAVHAGLGLIRMMAKLNKPEIHSIIEEVSNCLDQQSGDQAIKDRKELNTIQRQYYMDIGANSLAQRYALEELRYSDSLLSLSHENRESILQSLNFYRLANIRHEMDLKRLKINELENKINLRNERADLNRLLWIIFSVLGFFFLLGLWYLLRRKRARNRFKSQVYSLGKEV